MEQLINKVLDTMTKAGLVEVEVSARHVHLTEEDVEKLFGKGQVLHEKRPLSQKGQFLSEERVTLTGPKGKKERVAVLGPVRKATQVELSVSDCVALGVQAPLRESGDVKGSAPMIIEGPAGSIAISEGTIVAHNHIHVPTEVAKMLQISDKEHVSVKILSERPVTFGYQACGRIYETCGGIRDEDLSCQRKTESGIRPGDCLHCSCGIR